jgi:hypothetical protein
VQRMLAGELERPRRGPCGIVKVQGEQIGWPCGFEGTGLLGSDGQFDAQRATRANERSGAVGGSRKKKEKPRSQCYFFAAWKYGLAPAE